MAADDDLGFAELGRKHFDIIGVTFMRVALEVLGGIL